MCYRPSTKPVNPMSISVWMFVLAGRLKNENVKCSDRGIYTEKNIHWNLRHQKEKLRKEKRKYQKERKRAD